MSKRGQPLFQSFSEELWWLQGVRATKPWGHLGETATGLLWPRLGEQLQSSGGHLEDSYVQNSDGHLEKQLQNSGGYLWGTAIEFLCPSGGNNL
jgi:hypothetical protein